MGPIVWRMFHELVCETVFQLSLILGISIIDRVHARIPESVTLLELGYQRLFLSQIGPCFSGTRIPSPSFLGI